MTETSVDSLVEQVRSGDSPELRILAAQGILPLPPEQLIPLQVLLTAAQDEALAVAATESLCALEPKVALAFLAADAGPAVLRWFALAHPDPRLVETVLRRRDVPLDLLVEAAPRLSPDLQEVLLMRQDAIVERPDILDALERNPLLSVYARRRILEYREHLLPRERVAAAPEAEPAIEIGDLDEHDLIEIERARQLPRGGDLDERTGLTEAQIRSLPVPVRIKLSKGASRTLRGILLKDNNRMVALSVLAGSALSEDEVEQLAGSRSVDEEVLASLSRRREWISRYPVCLALSRNPKTPVGIAVRLVARLAVRDLKLLRKDRNVAEPVRSTAERLYRIKSN